MQTLTYGFEKPTTGDKGSVFFPALEDNITQLNDHTHNGTDSAFLPSTSVAAVAQTLASADWVDQGSGTYRQTATVPSGVAFYSQGIQVYISSTGELIYPQIVRVSGSSYYIYVNDNSLTLKVIYV